MQWLVGLRGSIGPGTGGVLSDRVFFAGRRNSPDITLARLLVRTGSTAPVIGPLPPVPLGTISGFMYVGTLENTLTVGDTYPAASGITVNSPLAPAQSFADAISPTSFVDLGAEIQNLLLIDDEIIGCTGAQVVSDTQVTLTGVARGMLDTVQAAHAAGENTRVYLLRGGLTGGVGTLPFVEIRGVPEAAGIAGSVEAATAVTIMKNQRNARPYPPSEIYLNGNRFQTTDVALEGAANPYGIVVTLNRRDFRSANETEILNTDAAQIFSDFPTNRNTRHLIDVYWQVAGGGYEFLYTEEGVGPDIRLTRSRILAETGGTLPTNMRIECFSRHATRLEDLDSLQKLRTTFLLFPT